MNPPFLPQQQQPGQLHNIIAGPNQGVNFPTNAHSSNRTFSNSPLMHIQAEERRRSMLAQSQRATASGGPSAMNGVVPAQPPGVNYAGMAAQNGQGPQRVVSQSVGIGPLATSHPHPVNMSNPALGLTGGLQTQRPGPQSQSQPQPQMGIRPPQPSLSGQPGVRPPSMGMPNIPSSNGMRGSGGMGLNMPPGMMGNISQQTQPQQGFPSSMGVGGPGPQPPPQSSQGPANSMSQPMHRPLSTPEGVNSFPGFTGGPFLQGTPHPPSNHIAGPNPPNHFTFMPTSSPSQPMDMGHNLSSGGAGPSGTSPTRSDFTVTPAQYASLQHGSGVPSRGGSAGMNEGAPPTFATMPPARPSSSSHSSHGLPHQQAQTPQGPSHPTPPRQQTPHQQPHMSPAQRFSAPMHNPIRPQSQPQRSPSQQQMRSSLTPHIPPNTLPPNAMLLQGHPASISSVSAPPPQPRPSISTSVGAGPPPLTPASSTENGDLSRQPGAPGVRPPMGYVYHPMSSLCLPSSLRIGSVVTVL